MKANKTWILAVAAVVLLGAGLFLTSHRSGQQATLGGGAVFSDLKPALAEVQEIRLSKGDGSLTTLRREDGGWRVVERQFPADPQRVRELLLAVADLRVLERKTADPANYAKIGVEEPDQPTAASTKVELVAGEKTWTLIVGKASEGRAVYARKPGEAASFLAAPLLTVDPDQKRWLDRLLVELPGAKVHEISGRVGKGPAYLLTRAQPGATEFTLSPVPKGRTPVNGLSLGGQADALASFHFDDVRNVSEPPATTDTVIYRTFDGQVITFNGRRDADKAYLSVSATRDDALAAKFATPPPSPGDAPAQPGPPPPAGEPIGEAPETAKPADATTPAADDPAAKVVERLAARTNGVEFEVPIYRYEAIFRPLEDLLEAKN